MTTAKKNTRNKANLDEPIFTLQATADLLSVTPATVRNWINAGYLAYISRKGVPKSSVSHFLQTYAGSRKLQARANKAYKPPHNHTALSHQLTQLIEKKESLSEDLGTYYESNLSDVYKNTHGIYYTPDHIITDLFNLHPIRAASATFCDPSCGSGNFILQAIAFGVAPENCYGFDTDPNAVAITIKRIYEQTGFLSTNILCADYLEVFNRPTTPKFDLIYTNPPWGKKFSPKQRLQYAKTFQASKLKDSCTLFLLAALQNIKDQGQIGLLLPDAVFNIANFETTRLISLKYQIHALKYYGKPFKKLQTGAVGLVLSKTSPMPSNTILCETPEGKHARLQSSFHPNPKSIFNVHCTQAEAALIRTLFALPHTTLKGNAQWGLGIVTGNNKQFLSSQAAPNRLQVYKGSDIQADQIVDSSLYIPANLRQYQQAVPLSFFQAKEKIVYKFISSKLVFFLDREQRFFLNSANMLIVNPDFPVSMQTICDLFNSNWMNWLFKKIFNTHKILRADLESLPIHYELLNQDLFCETSFLNLLNIERTSNGDYQLKR